MKAKTSPNIFLCPKLFRCFFQKKVGTLSFFFEILGSKNTNICRHFSMSQTFLKHRKSLGYRKFCQIAKYLKNEGKTTESQHFSMLKFLDGQAYSVL